MPAPRCLVDTNIVSYLFNEQSFGEPYKRMLQGYMPLLAAQTLAELRFGARFARWGERRYARLEGFLSDYTVIYPNDGICSRWGVVRVHLLRQGRIISEADAWIAATALEFRLPLVTHNRKDFDFIPNLDLISENRGGN